MPRLNDVTDHILTGQLGSVAEWAPTKVTGFNSTGINTTVSIFRMASSRVYYPSVNNITYLVSLDGSNHKMSIGQVYNNSSALKADLTYAHLATESTTNIAAFGEPKVRFESGTATVIVPTRPSDNSGSCFLRFVSGDNIFTQVFLGDSYYPAGYYNTYPNSSDYHTAELLIPGENGVWIAAVFKEGDSLAHIAYSSNDGVSWTVSSTTIPYAVAGKNSSDYMISGDYAQGVFVILVSDMSTPSSPVYVLTSTNSTGSSYTSSTPFTAASSFQPSSLKFNAGTWFVTGSHISYEDRIYYSVDLTNWYYYDSGVTRTSGSVPRPVMYSNGTQLLTKPATADTRLSIIGTINEVLLPKSKLSVQPDYNPSLGYALEDVLGSNTSRYGWWYYTDDVANKATADSITILRNYDLADYPPILPTSTTYKASAWKLEGRMVYNYVLGRSAYQPFSEVEKHPYLHTMYVTTAWLISGTWTAELRQSTDGIRWSVVSTNVPLTTSSNESYRLRVKGNNTDASILATTADGDIYYSSTGDLSSMTQSTINGGYKACSQSAGTVSFDQRNMVGVGNTWVVVGKASSNSTRVLLVSTDGGATFNAVTGITLNSGTNPCVSYGGDKFVSFDGNANHKLHYSSDGVNWTWNTGISLAGAAAINQLIYANSKWHLYRSQWPQSFEIISDITGSSHTYVQTWLPTRWMRMTYDNGKFVAVSEPNANGYSSVSHFTDAQGGGTVPNYSTPNGNRINAALDRYVKGGDVSNLYPQAAVYVNSTGKWIIPTDLGLIWSASDSQV